MKDITKWFGVQPTEPEQVFTHFEPPYGCTYVHAYHYVVNGTATLYTVPADTIFFLTSWGLLVDPVAAGRGYLRAFTGGDVLHSNLCMLRCVINDGKMVCSNLNIALQLPADYYIVINSGAASFTTFGWIIGYLRSV